MAAGRHGGASAEHESPGGRWLRSTWVSVRDGDGRPLYLFVQAEHVTEQRRTGAELHASEERFRLLVEGVCDDAIFMPRGGLPPIAVRARALGDTAEIRVADAGDGVDPALVTRIFQTFVQGRRSVHRGSGPGLFIVRELAKGQGGDAWYERTDGVTGAFCVPLPSA